MQQKTFEFEITLSNVQMMIMFKNSTNCGFNRRFMWDGKMTKSANFNIQDTINHRRILKSRLIWSHFGRPNSSWVSLNFYYDCYGKVNRAWVDFIWSSQILNPFSTPKCSPNDLQLTEQWFMVMSSVLHTSEQNQGTNGSLGMFCYRLIDRQF